MRKVMLPVLLIAGLCFAAEYRIKTVKVQPVESYPARIEAGGITVAADPYATDEKSYTAFDVKGLNSKGYYPVHVIVRNASPDYVTLKIRNVVLSTGAGQDLYTTSATIVVQDVFSENMLTTQPKPELLDFTGKELANRQIAPGEVSDGFVFFFTPEPKKNILAGSKLVIPEMLNESTRKPIGPFVIQLDPAVAAR